MCKAFSGLLLPDKKVFWKFGVDSHTDLVQLAKLRDDTRDPHAMAFARFEITPRNNNYLAPDSWNFRIDESITPSWVTVRHEEAAFAAHKKWLRKLGTILIPSEIIHPFRITPPVKITAKHVRLLKDWDSVRDSVGASVGDSVWASVRDSVWASVRDSVGDSVWASVRDSVGDSVWASVRDSVGDSVGDSVWAYIGSFFKIPKWKYIKHAKGVYPYLPVIKLWKLGLVPSFDGSTWRLHGGTKAAVVFSISAEELIK